MAILDSEFVETFRYLVDELDRGREEIKAEPQVELTPIQEELALRCEGSLSKFRDLFEEETGLVLKPLDGKFTDWLRRGTTQFDELWLRDAPKKPAIQVTLLNTGTIRIDLTTWDVNEVEKDAFAQYLRHNDYQIRESILHLSEELLPSGLAVELLLSRNFGQSRDIQSAVAWKEWQDNPSGLSTARVSFTTGEEAENVLDAMELEIGSTDRDELSTKLKRQFPASFIDAAMEECGVSQIVDQSAVSRAICERFETVYQASAAEGFDAPLIAAGKVFHSIIEPFRAERRRVETSEASRIASPPLDSSVSEIARALLDSFESVNPGFGETRPGSATGDFALLEENNSQSVLGWPGADKTAPMVRVSAKGGRASRHLTLEFLFDHQKGKGGRVAPSVIRGAAAYNLEGWSGQRLVDLNLEDPRVSFGIEQSVVLDPRNTEDLKRNWVWASGRPYLRWTFFSAIGEVDTWMKAPAITFGGLLGLVANPDEIPVIASVPESSYEAFISFPGSVGRTQARQILDLLKSDKYKLKDKVWHMDDHQEAGTDIEKNNEAGVQHSQCVILLLHSDYWRSKYCRREFEIAATLKKTKLLPYMLPEEGKSDSELFEEFGAELSKFEESVKSKDVKDKIEELRGAIRPVVSKVDQEFVDRLVRRLRKVTGPR